MVSQIVVPMDGSEFAERALPMAAGLARKWGAPLALVRVHVPAVPVEYRGEVSSLDWWFEEAKRAELAYLQRHAAAVSARTGTEVRPQLLTGAVVRSLADFLQGEPESLVVMTTHGWGGANRAWLGSVSDGLVRQSTTPVLLIQPGELPDPYAWDWEGFSHVLVPLDGSGRAESVLDLAVSLGGAGAKYTLVRVSHAPIAATRLPGLDSRTHLRRVEDHAAEATEYVEAVAARLRREVPAVATEVMVETPTAQGILRYAEAANVDLIVMATRGRSGWARFAVASVADRIARGAAVPVVLAGPRVRARDAEAAAT